MIGMKRMRSNAMPATRNADDMPDWRSAILADPSRVLADGELMNALLGVRDDANVADLNAAARARLQSEITLLKAANEDLQHMLRGNLAAQASAHAAVMGLMDEPTWPRSTAALQAIRPPRWAWRRFASALRASLPCHAPSPYCPLRRALKRPCWETLPKDLARLIHVFAGRFTGCRQAGSPARR